MLTKIKAALRAYLTSVYAVPMINGVAIACNLYFALQPDNPFAPVSWMTVGGLIMITADWWFFRRRMNQLRADQSERIWSTEDVKEIVSGCMNVLVQDLKKNDMLPPEFEMKFGMDIQHGEPSNVFEFERRPPNSRLN